MARVTITRTPGGRGTVLRASTIVPRPLEETFAFFADARNLERITPPSLRFRIVSDVGDGSTFHDMHIAYRLWRHEHAFEADGPHRTRMIDTVEFVPRGGRLAAGIVDRLFVAREVAGIFTWRARALEELLPAPD